LKKNLGGTMELRNNSFIPAPPLPPARALSLDEACRSTRCR
jgi:hypothetical protein